MNVSMEYLAGVLDAVGTIKMISPYNKSSCYPMIMLRTVDKSYDPVLVLLQSAFGGSVAKDGWSNRQRHWTLSGNKARDALMRLKPYMVRRASFYTQLEAFPQLRRRSPNFIKALAELPK